MRCGERERTEYLEREIESVKDMLDGAEDCKYIYQALLEYSRRYRELVGTEGDAKATKNRQSGLKVVEYSSMFPWLVIVLPAGTFFSDDEGELIVVWLFPLSASSLTFSRSGAMIEGTMVCIDVIAR